MVEFELYRPVTGVAVWAAAAVQTAGVGMNPSCKNPDRLQQQPDCAAVPISCLHCPDPLVSPSPKTQATNIVVLTKL